MSAFLSYLPWWAWIGIPTIILIVGFLSIIRRLVAVVGARDFARAWRNRFIEYANNQGRDEEAYTTLTLQSVKMQEAMGAYGIMSQFQPPFANYVYSNWPIILNALPELRRSYSEGDRFGYDRTAAQYANTINDALLRYLGQHAEIEADARKELWNPVSWFRTGVELLLVSPLLLLSAFGLFPVRLIQRLRRGGLFRAITSLVAFVSFVATIMAFVVDGSDAWEKIQRWMEGAVEQKQEGSHTAP